MLLIKKLMLLIKKINVINLKINDKFTYVFNILMWFVFRILLSSIVILIYTMFSLVSAHIINQNELY